MGGMTVQVPGAGIHQGATLGHALDVCTEHILRGPSCCAMWDGLVLYARPDRVAPDVPLKEASGRVRRSVGGLKRDPPWVSFPLANQTFGARGSPRGLPADSSPAPEPSNSNYAGPGCQEGEDATSAQLSLGGEKKKRKEPGRGGPAD